VSHNCVHLIHVLGLVNCQAGSFEKQENGWRYFEMIRRVLRSWTKPLGDFELFRIPGLNWKSLKSTSKNIWQSFAEWIPGKSPWDKKAGYMSPLFPFTPTLIVYHHHVQFISNAIKYHDEAKDNSFIRIFATVPHQRTIMFKIMELVFMKTNLPQVFKCFTGQQKKWGVRPGLYIARKCWKTGRCSKRSLQVNKFTL